MEFLNSQRLKVLRVSGRELITAIQGNRSGRVVEGCTCLPEGFRVVTLRQAPFSEPMAVDFLIEHPSFPEVPFEEEVPHIWCHCLMHVVPNGAASRPDTDAPPVPRAACSKCGFVVLFPANSRCPECKGLTLEPNP
jgi:hypothetical protein